MKIQFDGFTAEIEEIYANRAYTSLLAGRIDTKINNREESRAQNKLKEFSSGKKNHLYISPTRKKRKFSSFNKIAREMIKEEYQIGYYGKENYPEEKLEAFWVYIELVSYDAVKDEDCFMSALNIACNIENFELNTIEAYLLEHLTLKIWETNAMDATL